MWQFNELYAQVFIYSMFFHFLALCYHTYREVYMPRQLLSRVRQNTLNHQRVTNNKKCNCSQVVYNMNALKNDENLEKERGFSKYSILQYILTIDSFVQEVNEPFNSSQHLFPGEIQQWNDSETKLLQKIRQLMYIHDGGHQVRVVRVIQVANEECNFISG